MSVVSASTVLLVHGQQLMCIAHWAGGSQPFPALAILVWVSAPCETSAGYRLPAKEGGNALLRHLETSSPLRAAEIMTNKLDVYSA